MIETPQYERLRSWYLARLRKNAMEQSQAVDLTPLALIQQDQVLVQHLGTKRQTETDPKEAARKLMMVRAAYGLSVVIWLGVAAVCVFGQASAGDAVSILYRLTLGVLILDTADESLSRLHPTMVAALSTSLFVYPLVVLLVRQALVSSTDRPGDS